MNLLLLFIILTACNVIVGTIKSLLTIKGTKFWAAFINAVAYAFNTVAIFYTADEEIPMWFKIIIVAAINFIGVYIVKYIEEKQTKEKLWKIECTVLEEQRRPLRQELKDAGIYHRFIEGIGKYVIFNIYAETKEQSTTVKQLLKEYDAKYFVSENQTL